MSTPINSAGGTPIIPASERLTRSTFPGMIVDHDEIGDGIENFHPVPVRLLDPGEEARIFKRHRAMAGHGFQKDAIFAIQRTGASCQA